MSLVALDLRMVSGALHGIARYALELAARLPALAPDLRFAALVARGERVPLPAGVERVPCRRPFLDPAEQLELLGVLDRLRPDLSHWTSFSAPALSTAPCVITLHDANHLAFPEAYGPLHGLYYRCVVAPAARRAAKVITVSAFAARELEERLGLRAAEMAVIPNGVDPRFRPDPAAAAALRARLALPERFVLYVGNTKPHKNLGTLVEATARAGLPLVALVPRPPEARPAHVTFLSGLADADLPDLYAAAAVFAFPSLYEGFGLPPVEAMACGTPTVVADAASLPEVVGDAAVLVPPRDAAAWAAALTAALGPEAPGAVERRRAQAARFSWDHTAAQTLAVYRAALASRARAPSPASSPPAR